MKYQNLTFRDKDEVEQILKSSDLELKREALAGLVNNIDDFEWLQKTLLENIFDDDFWIAKNAIMGLADLARIHGKLDFQKVDKQLLLIDRDDLIPIINSMRDDLKIYL